jgi:ferrochelatase
MPKYVGPSQTSRDQPERIGVLLVNLGTPDDPTPAAVRRFLAEFLGDPRVVEAPRWWWLPVLHGVILRIRPARSAHAYRQIWTERGSPLLVYSRELAARLQTAVGTPADSGITVALGMTYGNPSIEGGLEQLREGGATRILVLPLYPQYSCTTTAPVFDRVTRVLQRWRRVPEIRFVADYYNEPSYIEACAASIEAHWRTHPRGHLLFSFHSVPKSYVDQGDPYHAQCIATARRIAQRLKLGENEWSISFQSRVGRAEWLRPYTDELLLQYAQQGPREITVACPGFATDCLETLEEIAIRNRELFLKSGGTAYDYVPALNASEAHVALLTEIVARHVQNWPSTHAASSDVREPAQRIIG